MNGLYHGECVAIGMVACSSDEVKGRLIPLLKKHALPYKYNGDMERAVSFIKQDKKCDGDMVSAIFVREIGEYKIEKMKVDAFLDIVCEEAEK